MKILTHFCAYLEENRRKQEETVRVTERSPLPEPQYSEPVKVPSTIERFVIMGRDEGVNSWVVSETLYKSVKQAYTDDLLERKKLTNLQIFRVYVPFYSGS